MKTIRRTAAVLALGFLVQTIAVSLARAEESTVGTNVAAGAISAIATLITIPLKLVTCTATVVGGGAVYGLTMGTSEIVREELVAGTNQTCGGRYYVSPQQVKQLAKESQP